MRKIILSVLGVLLLVLAVMAARAIISGNQRQRPKPQKIVKTVFVDTVRNATIPVMIQANGNLVAKRRLEIYSEVQGVLQTGRKLFRPGQRYQRGEVMISLDASEFYATVQSQKSNLYNQLAAIMPDLRLDYPDIYPKWQAYLNGFDINKPIPDLPEMTSETEKYFIGGRNIVTAYYNIKNLEQRLGKYRIRAPFSGILTEALVTEGTLIRPGQKIGEFIDTDVYELPVAINKTYADLLQVGKQVDLYTLDKTKQYSGEVSRINGNIDQATQTIDAFIEVKDEGLREGMYLEAGLNARSVEQAIQISRNLLQPNDQLFVVRDSVLDLVSANPVHFTDRAVILQGVPDGTLIVNKVVPGAYAGMLVKVFEEKAQPALTEPEEMAKNVD
jgi:multidrug efflux pump subunit AcrA (membrane-fusion protein)